jgi:hypothetical protein
MTKKKVEDLLSERADNTDPPLGGDGSPDPPFGEELPPPTVTDPDDGTALILVDSVQRKQVAYGTIVQLYPKLFRVCEVVGNSVSLTKEPPVDDKKPVPFTYHELRYELGLRDGVAFPPLRIVPPPPIPDEPA